jgi:hypothetical protein
MIANVRRRAISCMALMVGLSGSAPKMRKVFCFFSSKKKKESSFLKERSKELLTI